MAQLDGNGGAQCTITQVIDASGAPVVNLIGEIDISNAHQIGTNLKRLIGNSTTNLVIDLSALEFMDSAGIAMLLRAVTGVAAVTIRNPSTVVRRILECTGLDDILPIEQ
jgi:anti-anti-sigma factor